MKQSLESFNAEMSVLNENLNALAATKARMFEDFFADHPATRIPFLGVRFLLRALSLTVVYALLVAAWTWAPVTFGWYNYLIAIFALALFSAFAIRSECRKRRTA